MKNICVGKIFMSYLNYLNKTLKNVDSYFLTTFLQKLKKLPGESFLLRVCKEENN